MIEEQIIRGPILNPQADGTVEFLHDGLIHADADGHIAFIGEFSELAPCFGKKLAAGLRKADGVILPPFFDNHIHIPQHPIRGRFMEGVEMNPAGGRLLAGLNRNVFPAEAKCGDRGYTQLIVREFLEDTLSKGVVGGAAYMTVHPEAAGIALEMLPDTWHVGLVLMNQNCPEYLRTNEATLERDIRELAERFGSRLIVTDRFAVAVNSPLRKRAVQLAEELELRMQTHLNEQMREKQFVERELYPDAKSYTDVYRRDGLLDCEPILAHCVYCTDAEFDLIAADSSAAIAHCPTSNTLLGSGIMNLDKVVSRGIDYAICTDVGASPTTSMLCEMAEFLKVHRGKSRHATATEALFRSTIAPVRMLDLHHPGTLVVGAPLSFIEVECSAESLKKDTTDEVILGALLGTSSKELDEFAERAACRKALDALQSHGLDIGPDLNCLSEDIAQTQRRLEHKVVRVVMQGETVWKRG